MVAQIFPQVGIADSNFISSCEILAIDYKDAESDYALGKKYSRVVKFGLSTFLSLESCGVGTVGYVGVLDSDVFPERQYYEKLMGKFFLDKKLGIASGGLQKEEDGIRVTDHYTNRTHAPGGLRVWRKACLMMTGYESTISQDAVSEARAIMFGWRVRSFLDIFVSMRKRGSKYGFDYYGKSAYVRWVPFWYVLLGAFKMVLQRRKQDAMAYIAGYQKAKMNREPRIDDPVAKRYFRYRFIYKLIRK
jgi:hypothetical protein